VLAHAAFWVRQFHLDAELLFVALFLLSARWMESELGVLAVVSMSHAIVACLMPQYLQTIAFMSALLFAVHAFRKPTRIELEPAATRDDYRAGGGEPAPEVRFVFARAPRAVFARQMGGAAYAYALSVWAVTWTGGAWPAHDVTIALATTAIIVPHAIHFRSVLVALPLAGTYVHWALRARLLQTELQWGLAAFSFGIATLAASLATSVRMSREGLGGARCDDRA
jgi:hypothetical protein